MSIAADAEEAGIVLTPIQARDVAAAAGSLYDGIAGRPARDPDTGEMGRDPRVVRHLNFDQVVASVDITPVIACANALWGYTTREQIIEQPFFGAYR